VVRVERRIERFAREAGIERACVQIHLADGTRYLVEELSAEPGFGFVTIRPYPRDESPAEVIVPVGMIRRIELDRAEEQRAAFGFTLSGDR
jgi:hypothetical protein